MTVQDGRVESSDRADRPCSKPARPDLELVCLFQLPAVVDVPGDHPEIESLIEAGQLTEAAASIHRLTFRSIVEQNRAARAEAICWLRAGCPEVAADVLSAGRRTIAKAWLLACAYVRLARLEEAAQEVLWVGERMPMLGADRAAARALFTGLGRTLPSWLFDPCDVLPEEAAASSLPPPYLAGFFYPSRPEVPGDFEDVAEEIQRGRYHEAGRLLVSREVGDPRLSRQIAVAAAECWVLAGEPAAAEALLHHRVPAEGIWARACARVQRNNLEGALKPLVWLARRGELDEERRAAVAALVAHLGLATLPAGLEILHQHPFLHLDRAQEAGYQVFTELINRRIAREGSAEDVARIVQQAVVQCANSPEDEARKVLVPIYETAVRATGAPGLAERGFHLLVSRLEDLAGDDGQFSRALLFATACGRVEELRRRLHALAGRLSDDAARFSCWLAVAKLSLVLGDTTGLVEHAARAAAMNVPAEARARASRLGRAARWVAPGQALRISWWQLRQLHDQLPRDVAEHLEDPSSRLWERLERYRSSPAAAVHVEAAARHLDDAVAIAKAPTPTLPHLRLALGSWALRVGLAVMAHDASSVADAIPFTAAACRLLGPGPPAHVVEAHARAVDAWRGSRPAELALEAERYLDRTLQPVGVALPPISLADATAAIGGPDGIPDKARELILRCARDRSLLLPAAPPFRGRRWFGTPTAHERYGQGREETDPRAALKAFEDAWTAEPHNYVTTQGLILGLAGSLRVKPSRAHLLEYVARYLDQLPGGEIEAALAYSWLAELTRQDRQRRPYLERAAGALNRRVRRQPWVRVRNAQIAVHLALGNLVPAGQAAWEESRHYLPGTSRRRRYALLAATLWSRAELREPSLVEMIARALRSSREVGLTNREAVHHAVHTGRLVSLSSLVLDDDALEDLWRGCRGDESHLCRFLERQATRIDARPDYLKFLVRKLEGRDPAAAARIRSRFLEPSSAVEPAGMAHLRLAAAELLVRDPLTEVATSRDRLTKETVREFLACLRSCAQDEDVAYTVFHAAVEDALAALFDLRVAAPVNGAELYGGRLAKASESLEVLRRAANGFGSPALATMATLLAHYLALGLDAPAVEAYSREKDKRLIPSRLGSSLGSWWAQLCEHSGSLDFFHHHEAYRYSRDQGLEEWWRSHQVHGRPVREAMRELVASLETDARRLRHIETQYLSSREAQDLPLLEFGLGAEFASCCAVLRSALEPGAGPDRVARVERALAALGVALRRIDLARLVDVPGLLYDSSLPPGRYLLPRVVELFAHWKRNVRGDRCLQALFEVDDDSGREVLCILTLDREGQPVPEYTPLRGLAPFADLVEALGGQFHLWAARPGEVTGCRRDHGDRARCAADDYVVRIERKLRGLAMNSWHSQRQRVLPWLRVLNEGIAHRAPAALSFGILPQLYG